MVDGDINIEDGVKVIESRFFYQLSCPQPSTINVYIPASVEIIDAVAFTTKDSLCQMNIYCAALSKPSGWVTNWCASSSWVNVTWGYQG